MNPTQEVRTCLDICDQRQGEDKAKQRPFCVSVAVAKAAGAYHLIPEKKRGTRVCGRDPSDTVRIGGETSGHSAEELPLWKLHPGLRRLAQLFAGYYVCNGCYSRFKGSAFKSSLQRIWEDDELNAVAVPAPLPLVGEQEVGELQPELVEQALPACTLAQAQEFVQAAPQGQESAGLLVPAEQEEQKVARELQPKLVEQALPACTLAQAQEFVQVLPLPSAAGTHAEPPGVAGTSDLPAAGAAEPAETTSSPPPKRARMAHTAAAAASPPPVVLDEHPQGQQLPEEEEGEGEEEEDEGQEEAEVAAAEDVAGRALWATVFAPVDALVRAVLRRADKQEGAVGGGAGTEGMFGSCAQRGMLNGLAFWVRHMGFGPSSVLVDMGSGLGRPGIIAVTAARVRHVYNIELDGHKFDKANGVLDAVTRSSEATGAGLDFSGTHNMCAPIEAFGIAEDKENWAGSVKVPCPDVGTKRVTRSTTRCAPIREIPYRVPQPTHIYTFWEGIPIPSKQHLAYLVSNTPSIQSIFIVQKGGGDYIMEDMAHLGFKRLVLVHQLVMKACGGKESFRGFIFEVLPPPPPEGTSPAEAAVAGHAA